MARRSIMRMAWGTWVRRLLAALLGLVAASGAMAAYPEQTIRLVVGFPPGGGGDLYGRLIAQALGKSLGQTVVVENRAGAGGNIAADAVAKAAAAVASQGKA